MQLFYSLHPLSLCSPAYHYSETLIIRTLDYPNSRANGTTGSKYQNKKMWSSRLPLDILRMRDIHCCIAAVHEQWPTKLILALKEAKNASKWFCQSIELLKISVSVVLVWSSVEFQLSELFAYLNP